MKQNLDEEILNTLVNKKSTRRGGTTNQAESRATPKVSLNQEVYRPCKEHNNISFNQHQNQGTKKVIPIPRAVIQAITGITIIINGIIRITETLR